MASKNGKTRVILTNDHILVSPEAETESAGGIALPDMVHHDGHGARYGTVQGFSDIAFRKIAEHVGPSQKGFFKIGVRVKYFAHSLSPVMIDGEEFNVIKPGDIWFIEVKDE